MALENLLDNYREFEKISKNRTDENQIDLGDLELNPTLLLLLEFFAKNNGISLLK